MRVSEGDLRPVALARLAAREAERSCGPYRLRQGFLVAVEGIDGAGVSTTAEALARVLDSLLDGSRACYTKEPTLGPVGFLIRQALAGYVESLRSPQVLALLFAADRVWHLLHEPLGGRRGVIGCLGEPAVVVSDRYKYSSMAYQRLPASAGEGGLPGASLEWLETVNSYAPPAHFLVYVDVPADVALERMVDERWMLQLYEKRLTLERVAESFRDLLDRLQRQPEAPARGAAWAGLLASLGVDPEKAYPGGSYPVILRLDGTSKPSANVARAACWVLEEAARRGLAERV